MFAIFNFGRKLLDKLRKKSYRVAYVGEHVRRGVAYQIRALRDQRGWKQGELAKKLGKPQSVICRLEDPSYGKVTVQTLLEVADVFDVALQVRFVSYSSFLGDTRDVSAQAMYVPSFEEEASTASAPFRIESTSATASDFNVTLNEPTPMRVPGPSLIWAGTEIVASVQ